MPATLTDSPGRPILVASRRISLLRLAVATALLVLLVGGVWLFRQIREVQDAVVQTNMRARLFQLSVALHSYHDWYGRLPPLAFAAGDPPHAQSWRVATIRSTGSHWESYSDSLAWNAPGNLRAAKTIRNWLQVGHLEPPAPEYSRILAIDGPGSPWRSGDILHNQQLPFLAYVPESTVQLLEPRDLTLDDLRRLATTPRPGQRPVYVIPPEGRPRILTIRDVELFEAVTDHSP